MRTVGDSLRATATAVSEISAGVSAATRVVRGPDALTRSDSCSGGLRHGALARPPVMLVHGLAGDRSCFRLLERQLHREGFTVDSIQYSSVGSVARCGRAIEDRASWLLEQTGADQAHVVAHSLGGVALRWAVGHTWVRDWIGVAITLGTPHRGSPLARLAPTRIPGFGKVISELRPEVHDESEVSAAVRGPVRWVSIAAQYDWVVPPRYARLPEGEYVRNVHLNCGGHLTLPRNSRCMDLVLEELTGAPMVRSIAS